MPGEGVEEDESGTAFAALAKRDRGMGFSSKSMSSSFGATDGEGLSATSGS